MSLSVVSNYAASIAHNNLMQSQSSASEYIAQLSSGSRIVQASDDAASLAIGDKLNAEVQALNQASVNAGQATSVLQIADGAYSQINNILTRMQVLAVQSSSGQLSGTQRAQLNTEYQALTSEIDRISNVTDFNGTQLINGGIKVGTSGSFGVSNGVDGITYRGSFSTSNTESLAYNSTSNVITITDGTVNYTGTVSSSAFNSTSTALTQGTVVTLTNGTTSNSIDVVLGQNFNPDQSISAASYSLSGSTGTSFSFQVGAGTTSNDQITLSVSASTSSALGVSGTDITSVSTAQTANTLVSNAINALQTFRASVGAGESRLNFATSNLSTATTNLEAARSSLMDVDVAEASSHLASKQILVQIGVAELAQANQLPQMLLKLVG